MPRFLYGDSYGQIGSQELAQDQARDSRWFRSLDAQRALDALAQQQQQSGVGNALHVASLIQNAREQALQNRLAQQRYSDQQNLSMLHYLLQNQQFYDSLKSNEKVAGMRIKELQARDTERNADQDYAEAAQLAEHGVPTGTLSSLFKLTPQQNARLAARVAALAAQEEDQVGPVEQAQKTNLSTLQGLLNVKKREAAIGAALKEFTPFTWDSTIKERINKLPAENLPPLENETLDKWIQDNLVKKKLDTILAVDPQTQRIVPIPIQRRFPKALLPTAPPVASPAAGTPFPAAGPSLPQRPQGLSDDQLLAAAMAAIRSGKDTNAVIQRLQSWGLSLK